MNRATVIAEIAELERKLQGVSEKTNAARVFNTIDLWLEHVLEHDLELARHFGIPTEDRTRNALLTLVATNSAIRQPIVNMLATRISSYLANISELQSHPLISQAAAANLNNLEPLVKLIRNHDIYFEQPKLIEIISEALKHQRLHIYQSYAKEPDLRIVLKTLQQDTSRDDRTALEPLLDFLFDQLARNLVQQGFISQRRHAWWALLDVLRERDLTWLQQTAGQLNDIILGLLRASEHSSSTWDPTTAVPAIYSAINEDVWVTINMMRIFRMREAELFPTATWNLLRTKIESNFRKVMATQYDDSVRSDLCKLLVLYEALAHENHVEMELICSRDALAIGQQAIGAYLFASDVVQSFSRAKATLRGFVENRNSWSKHMLSTLLVSGPAGSGKSELMRQIIDEIHGLVGTDENGLGAQFFTIGSEINNLDDLQNVLSAVETETGKGHRIRVIAFDEFDKAGFDLPTAFLKPLAAATRVEEPITIWLFGQSSYSTFDLLRSYAEASGNIPLRDFLTRFQLGKIDLPDLRSSPQQRLFTALGYALSRNPNLERVSVRFVRHFASGSHLQNNRQLIAEFESGVVIRGNEATLRDGDTGVGSGLAGDEAWIRIER